MTTARKLFVKTWGCQMNVYDTKRMTDVLRPLGYAEVDTPEDADMVILNTCHIREKATDKVFSELGRLREYKAAKEQNGGSMILAVAGCVAQAEGDVILDRAKYVDMVFGPQTYHQLPEMVAQVTGAYGSARIVNTDFPAEEKFDYLPEESAPQGPSAFLSIQEGCDKFCTFCVVPYTRGAEFSRPPEKIIDEAKRLAGQGTREITVLGQNVNAYHGVDAQGRTWSLGELLNEMALIEGIERLRYTTSHPKDVDDDLIAAHRDNQKLMPFIHLPVQSGSDAMLKAMNRKHTADFYREIITKFRAARVDVAFSSDFIVGFPGETDKDFEDTLQLIRDVNFASAYSFKYSPRPGTPAANMQNLVRESVKSERLQVMQALLNEQQLAFNQSKVGQTVPMLFDGRGNREGQLHGRSPWNQSMHITAPARLYGQIENVVITKGGPNSVDGKLAILD
jgi:tRNA-2-methylthio-N6-dimethylallyladenosine synthase